MALTTSEKSNLLFKKHLGYANTREQRAFFEEAIKSSFVVQPSQLWTYSDRIPDGTDKTGGDIAVQKIKNLNNNEFFFHYKNEAEDQVPLVKRFIKLTLTTIDAGTDNAFLIADEHGNQIKDIIPFNYADEIYNYELYTHNDEKIPFGVGDWIVDTFSGVVTFYGEVPQNVDHLNPPKLSFYQYVGGNGFRQDTYGFDGAILPLDNVEIKSGTVSFTVKNDTTTLYSQIVEKANEILPDDAPYSFVDTFGWDGNNSNEGIALSFEKIIPLTYMKSKDPVKGYDKATDSEIGTLLSGKNAIYTSSNYEILFASQKLKTDKTYKISIVNDKAIGSVDDIEQDPILISGNEWNVYKIWVSDNAFIILRVKNKVDEEIVFTVQSVEDSKIISCLLLYWDSKDKQYQPFLTKDECVAQLGFPVVTVNGRLPPTVQLGTSALATFQDTITPDYYGPRTFTVTIARDNGTDVKSADFIVKNTNGWYLDDILKQVAAKYPNFVGTIFLRAGTYKLQNNLNLDLFNNAIITGEGYSTTIHCDTNKIEFSVNEGIFELSHIRIIDCNSIKITSNANVFISNILTDCDISCEIKKQGHLYIRNISARHLNISGEDTDLMNIDIRGSFFSDVIINTNSVFFKGNTANSLTVLSDKANFIKDNILNKLNSKYKELFLDGNTIFEYGLTIPNESLNQLPIGTDKDTIFTPGIDELKSTGRFPIFDKDDHIHLKYAEFAQPFHYNKDLNIIELLYDTNAFKIVDGRLKSVMSADQLVMPDNTIYPRHPNSELPPKEYTNSDPITKVFADLWKEKADLDENGKIPLQELPDSVAYGGLLYVGNWCFETNHSLYPKFENAHYTNKTNDDEITQLQKGWFFIVSPPPDTSDTDTENDNPVVEQIAYDGVKFTAGDWIIYVGDGKDDETNTAFSHKSWEKIDRAYSDPTYSPLPGKATIPGGDNNWWYWKQVNGTGALDLSNKTIIEAFKKVNDQLKKLEPKLPVTVSNVKIQPSEDYLKIYYREIINNTLSSIKSSYDSTGKTEFKFETQKTGPRTYKDLIYFGDEASISIDVDGNNYETIISQSSVEYTDPSGTVTISEPQDTMKEADHGENFWKGFYAKIHNTNVDDGLHSIRLTVDDIKLLYDKDPHTDLHAGFGGSTEVFTYTTLKPYFPDVIKRDSLIPTSFANTVITNLMESNSCSGIPGFDLNSLEKLSNFKCHISNVYKNKKVPTERLCEVKVLLNDSKIFCDSVVADSVIKFEDGNDTLPGYNDLIIDGLDLPITIENKNIIITEKDTLDFYITIYDLYNVPHTTKIYTYKNLRVDKTKETERCKEGIITQNSAFNSGPSTFGGDYDSQVKSNTSLAKIGTYINNDVIGIYQQPKSIFNGYNFDTNWTGQEVKNELIGVEPGFYGVACFKIGKIKDASGFSFKIDTDNTYTFDNLSISTKDVIIQMCIVDEDKPEKKQTHWLDCNRPYDGFSKINVKEFMTPVMYAGNSNATYKRITFGRHQLLSGDVYIRIGIKKDSNLTFRKIEFVEEI